MKAPITGAVALVLMVFPIHANDKHVPLPASVLAAKTVYIDNQTGHAEIADRADEALTKWAIQNREGRKGRRFDPSVHSRH